MTKPLTPQQHRILTLVAQGLSNPEIAAELDVVVDTVKAGLSRALTKLAARNRAHAVAVAYDRDILKPGASTRTAAA